MRRPFCRYSCSYLLRYSWEVCAQGGLDILDMTDLVILTWCHVLHLLLAQQELRWQTEGKHNHLLSIMHFWRPIHSRNRFTDNWASWNVRSCICLSVIWWWQRTCPTLAMSFLQAQNAPIISKGKRHQGPRLSCLLNFYVVVICFVDLNTHTHTNTHTYTWVREVLSFQNFFVTTVKRNIKNRRK